MVKKSEAKRKSESVKQSEIVKNWEIMNEAEASDLFSENAMMIGFTDKVPTFVAVDIFGRDIVKQVQTEHKEYTGEYNCGGITCAYLTRLAFLMCVSMLNLKKVQLIMMGEVQ